MKIEQGMTRVGRRLIEDFLVPALNDGRYGDRLKWVDKDNLCFSIKWSHKNAAKWSLEDTVVFQDWDRMKGHFHPEIKGYYMQAKQRFRAALYKLNTVRHIRSTDKQTKLYQLVLDYDKKKNGDFSVVRSKKIKDSNQAREGIPTSVIQVNRNYVPGDKSRSGSVVVAVNRDLDDSKSPKPVEDFPMCEDSTSASSCSDHGVNGMVISNPSDIMVTSSRNGGVFISQRPPAVTKVKVVASKVTSRPHPHIPVQQLPQCPRAGSSQPRIPLSHHTAFQNDNKTIKPEGESFVVESADGVLNLSKKPLMPYIPISARLTKENFFKVLGLQPVK